MLDDALTTLGVRHGGRDERLAGVLVLLVHVAQRPLHNLDRDQRPLPTPCKCAFTEP